MARGGPQPAIPYYFSYFDIACAGLAAILWLAGPDLGLWPLILGLAPWVIRWSLSRRPGTRTAFDVSMGIFLVTAIVSVWAAYDRQAALAKFWLLVSAVLLFYALANWLVVGKSRAFREQAWLLSVIGAATAGYFLISHDWAGWPVKSPAIATFGTAIQELLPRFAGEQLHPNVAGGILAVLAPFSGATALLAWKGKRLWLKIVAIMLLALTLIGLLFTVTRGSWLALALACGLAAWWPLTGFLAQERRQRFILFTGPPVAMAIGALLVFGLWPAAVNHVLRSLPAVESGGQRIDLYANSLNLISDYPIIGSGLGSFMMVYSSYSLLTHVGFSTHSHNLYFDIIIEQGIVALAALSWMWLLMFESVWRSLRAQATGFSGYRHVELGGVRQLTSEDGEDRAGRSMPEERIVLGAAAISLVVILVQGLIDDPIYSSRAVVIFFVPLAFGVPILLAAARPSRSWQLRFVLAVAVLMMIVIAIWWKPLLSRLRSNIAAVEQSRAELGVYQWPDWPIQDAVRREVDLSKSIDDYEKALALHAENASANRRLGQIELSLGQYEAALSHLKKAYVAAPWDNGTRQLLGEAYIVNGYVEIGRELWNSVDNSMNQLDFRLFWYDYLGEDPPLAWVRQATR